MWHEIKIIKYLLRVCTNCFSVTDGLIKADSRSSKGNYHRGGRSYNGYQQKGSKVETSQKYASGGFYYESLKKLT
jgi:hypothetical protein